MDNYEVGRRLANTRGSRYYPLSTNLHYQKGFLSRFDNRKKCGPTAIACGETCISDDKECLEDKYSQTLDAVEKSIIYKQKEELSFIDPQTGKEIYRFYGDESSVGIDPDTDTKKLVGAIATHNHPPLHFTPGEPRSTGVSFSAADISSACYFNLGEIRAASPGYRFSMKPPDKGWDTDFFEKEVAPAYNRNMSKNYTKNFVLVNLGFRDSREAQRLVHHETWLDTARETGMKYSAKRVAGESLSPRNFKEGIKKAGEDVIAGTERAIGLAITATIVVAAKDIAQSQKVLPTDEEIKARAIEAQNLIHQKIQGQRRRRST